MRMGDEVHQNQRKEKEKEKMTQIFEDLLDDISMDDIQQKRSTSSIIVD